ncbi:hypothetical protein KC19_8G108200 [Ceratodon purpureus]|uniref:F-box domain-containing protein n=1 Tax=Ceratodon purpureus TaxID=3225 RepID=A0A8T0H229_CERPU|nr:hypothetical protein KC19_8G108200 [Ceratodon purpureus]KAG0564405.1 hypothetical protein KC19_8G108200 [Ceratodon purpureus]KAG0564406.1 hypothetical protein KC19_8G108200 [Ceratodon purpureus]KAG0564407.1 hypothetical protein KC19_8G108200 [Ceratodon purpureus]KAG0564408.1 hypothetical protein KC19_8G108200 [Ceratodon purpureus]
MALEMEEEAERVSRDEEGTFVWSELPKDVQHKVLSCLPIQDLCQMRCVCKQWRDVIHRREFRSMYDIVNSGSQNPSPVICYMESSYPIRLEWAAYDYAGRTWKKMNSFPSLPQSILTQLSVRRHYSLSSVGGLLCLYFWKEEKSPKGYRNYAHNAPPGVSSWTVWHPFRNKWKRLPPCKHRVSDRAPLFVHAFVSDEQAKTYKILMAHHPKSHRYQFDEGDPDRRLVTEIYDSATGVWTDGAEFSEFSQGFRTYPQAGLIRRGVRCNDMIYFLTGGYTSIGQNALLSYDIKNDRWHEESYSTRYPIFEWDGRLMSITLRTSEPDEWNRMLRTYSFVEMNPDTRRWEDTGIEIPWNKILIKFRNMDSLAIVASGNELAFTGSATGGGFKIAVYKRAENYWRLPPTGAFSDKMERSKVEGLLLHTPLLDWRP